MYQMFIGNDSGFSIWSDVQEDFGPRHAGDLTMHGSCTIAPIVSPGVSHHVVKRGMVSSSLMKL